MRIFRWILFPISLVYGISTGLRNLLYDIGVFSVYKVPVPSITVGNLNTGGTGKTPHIVYLAEYLKGKNNVAILSRGYGRYTKGFLWVYANSKATDVGDEPLMYARIFKDDLIVSVCEDRKSGVERILREFPETNLILLDDAFQHRKVQATLSILLTEFKRPFFADFVLPMGNLREWKIGRNRADLLIATKCPAELDVSQKKMFITLANIHHKPIYFSTFQYDSILKFNGIEVEGISENILLITGIANPQPLFDKLSEKASVTHLSYGDHHPFTVDEIKQILQKFDTFADENKIILTTEKDFVRLIEQVDELKLEQYPWCYIPIKVQIEDEEEFKATIDKYVRKV